MSKDKKFYAVFRGVTPGIYTTWAECKAQVDGYSGARYKSFHSKEEAESAMAYTPNPAPAPRNKRSVTLSPSEVMALEADVIIYADGGCKPNPGLSGSGIAIYRNKVASELLYGMYHPTGTNNTAELTALIKALDIAQMELSKGSSVIILSDSRYSIQCVTEWARGWKQRGWKLVDGGPVKNEELVKEAYDLYVTIEDRISVEHVNGHVGVEGNELADRMTLMAIRQSAAGWNIYPKGFLVNEILDYK